MNVRDEIITNRRIAVADFGPAQGLPMPSERTVPIVPFCPRRADGGSARTAICEIKRASPSKGEIAKGLDAPERAKLYEHYGIRNISVLTEESRFGGSLRDLVAVKRACPGVAFLRKDFLLDVKDVIVSYLFGADAVLLIASILDRQTLLEMRNRALLLGMRALVEVHSQEDVEKARYVRSDLTGVNCRDLETMKLDLLYPLGLRPLIDWDTQVVFESGIKGRAEAAFAGGCGFDGILVGESVTRDPAMIPAMAESFYNAPLRRFWPSLASRTVALDGRSVPLVKICGLTKAADVAAAEACGADLLGFVFAESVRKVDAAFIRSLGESGVPRVAVLTCPPAEVPEEVAYLAQGGRIDAVQFHDSLGSEDFIASVEASSLDRLGIPFYKSVGARLAADVSGSASFPGPRVLLDAYSPDGRGGTGRRLDGSLVRAAAAESAGLWLAGGLTPENAGSVAREFAPELMDASSGLESSPGIKDAARMKAFVKGAKNA